MHYDRTGSVISEEDWKVRWADPEYRILARTDVGEWTVAAWWAGTDEDVSDRRIFRTALLVPPRQAGFGSPLLQEWRHRTAEDALAHHEQLVSQMEGEGLHRRRAATPTGDSDDHCHCC